MSSPSSMTPGTPVPFQESVRKGQCVHGITNGWSGWNVRNQNEPVRTTGTGRPAPHPGKTTAPDTAVAAGTAVAAVRATAAVRVAGAVPAAVRVVATAMVTAACPRPPSAR